MAFLVNTAVIFTLGFVSHKHRDARQWDRRIISAVSVGLLMLCFGEGRVFKRYRIRDSYSCPVGRMPDTLQNITGGSRVVEGAGYDV